MSGHANFSAIEGVRPTLPAIQQPGEDIGVSLNKSVGVVKGAGLAGGGEEGENVPLQDVGNGAEKASALVQQLDVLLARAAESATKGIDAASLKDTLNQVNLSKGDRKTMNAAADKADAAFKALIRALEKSDNEVLKANREQLANNRLAHFSNAGLGEQWYALRLEEPRYSQPRQRMQWR